MTHLTEWKFTQKLDQGNYHNNRDQELRLHDFRQLMTEDQNYIVNKTKMMAPVYDFATSEPVNMKTKKGNWLTQLIGRESTYDGLEKAKQAKLLNKDVREVEIDQQFEEEDSDQEQNFFHGSAYHQMIKSQRAAQRRLKPVEHDQKQKEAKEVLQNKQLPAWYIQNRPGAKLVQLNDRQKTKNSLVIATTVPITGIQQIDTYIMQYFENTKDAQNVYLDNPIFKQTAFRNGLPAIVIDLLCYLCGGFHQQGMPFGQYTNDVWQQLKACIKTNFDDRIKYDRKSNLAKLKFGAQKPFQNNELLAEEKQEGKLGYLAQRMMKLINRKMNRLIPPLKEYPEPMESDRSYDSDEPENEAWKNDYVYRSTDLHSQLAQLCPFKESWTHCRDFFKKVSRVQPAKLAKMTQQNAKLPHDQKEMPLDRHFELTEETLRQGFKDAFGTQCDIFAKLLYIKCSNQKNFAKLSFCDLIDFLLPLLNDNRQLRNRAVFNILDSNDSGEIELVQLLNIHKCLPDMSLFKHEIYLLIEEYKTKNILKANGFKSLQPITFSLYNKIIPQSAVAKHLAFSVFGYYLPVVFEEECKDTVKAPDNPFEPMTSKEEWLRKIEILYPRDVFAEEFDMEKARKNMLTHNEIENIYNASSEFADRASYITKKLR